MGSAVDQPPRGRARIAAAIALGASLAWRGAMVKVALVVCAFTVLLAVAVAAALGNREVAPPLAELASATSSALAWGGGALVAFTAAAHALRTDRSEGLRALLEARGASPYAYARGRIIGLVVVVAVAVAGGALIAGLATILVAAHAGHAASAARGVVGSIAYGLAFAIVISPLAFAALGGRSRAGGYLGFLALLVLPELVRPWTRALVPHAWRDLLSVPSALASLRDSLMPPTFDAPRLVRATVALALFAIACFAIARAEIARVDAEGEERA